MSSPIDLAKISEAVGRPGIDPRSHISLAVVTAVSVDENGVIADVTLLPSELEEHATLAPEYAGAGYGIYFPLEVDQMVVVGWPEGDAAHGLRIIARCWDGGEKPPADVAAHPTDVLMLIKTDATCRMAVAGSGDLVLEARGSGKVKLGKEAASLGVARKTDTVAIDPDVLQSALDLRYVQLPGPPPPPTIKSSLTTAGHPDGAPGTITGASDEVVSS